MLDTADIVRDRDFSSTTRSDTLVAKPREIEAMSKSSFASEETKVYRLTLFYRVYHFVVGIAALVGAVWCYHFLILAAGLALFSVFMIARPLVMKVTVDQNSVAVKGMFSESSMQRSSITAFERIHTGKGSCLMFRGNDESESLMIPEILFGFDEAWEAWLNTYRDLSDDKPISLFGGRSGE